LEKYYLQGRIQEGAIGAIAPLETYESNLFSIFLQFGKQYININSK